MASVYIQKTLILKVEHGTLLLFLYFQRTKFWNDSYRYLNGK